LTGGSARVQVALVPDDEMSEKRSVSLRFGSWVRFPAGKLGR
jgi:predicted AAA+ superfamily ATPase